MPRLLQASQYVSRLELVDIDGLVASGIRCVLLDRDNTCVPRDTKVAPAAVEDWLSRAKQAGLHVCLVSNNFHTSEVSGSARELGLPFVDHAMKPSPHALRRAMGERGFSPQQTVMIGDQVFTDVLAGNLAGTQTILVRPQSRRDLWYTHVFRVFESIPLHGKTFQGE